MFEIRPDVETLRARLLLIVILCVLYVAISLIGVLFLADYFGSLNWRFTFFVWLNSIFVYPQAFIVNKLGLSLLVNILLIGPIIEELEFRLPLWIALKLKKPGKFLYNKQYLLWIIILANGTFFGLLHLRANPVALFAVVLAGIFPCYLVARTRAFWPAVVFHILMNCALVAITMIYPFV